MKKSILLFAGLAGMCALSAAPVPNFNFAGNAKNWKLWNCTYDAKVSRSADGSGSCRFDHKNNTTEGHVEQTVVLNQKSPVPLLLSVWCKADIPEKWAPDQRNFALRSCVIYTDGTKRWECNRFFPSGKYDWQKRQVLVIPEKPVRAVQLFGRFALHTGTVWFDEFQIDERPDLIAGNRVKNPCFSYLHRPWNCWNCTVDQDNSCKDDGSGSCRFVYKDNTKAGHVHQDIELNQSVPAPIIVSCFCKADIPDRWGEDRQNFALRTCLEFTDGTKTWRNCAALPAGKYGWMKKEMLINAEKPVKKVSLFGRFAYHRGTVWFDDFRVETRAEKKTQPVKIEKVQLPGKCEGLRIQNSFFSITLDPGRGGSCVEFKSFVNGKIFGGTALDYRGLGGDRIGAYHYQTTFKFPFKPVLTVNTPEELQLDLVKEDLPNDPYLKFTKIITVRKDSGALKIRYIYKNRAESMAPKIVKPHFRQAFFLRDIKSFYTVPESSGSRLYPAFPGGDTYIKDVTRPFAGVSDEKGNGLAMEYDLALLDSLYMWREAVNKSTMELFFRPVKVAEGKEFSTEVILYPYAGLKTLSGAANGIAAELSPESLRLFTADAVSGTLEFSVIRKNGTETVLKHAILTGPGETLSLIPPRFDRKGVLALKLELKQGGRPFFRAEKPLVPQYKLKAEVQKIAPASDPLISHTLSTEVVTPHVPWAKKWAKGPVKVLFITDSTNGRDLVELAQRMDVELHTLWISGSEGQMKWGRAAMFGRYTFADANRELARQLKARQYDAIVIAGRLPKFITKENVSAMGIQLKRGAGFLVINPEFWTAPFQKLLMIRNTGRSTAFQSWRKSAAHPVVSGVVPELFPRGIVLNASIPGGTTLLAADNKLPLLQLAPSGKAALISANTGSGGLLPFLPKQYPMPRCKDYVEFQFVPLIRTLLQISGKLPAALPVVQKGNIVAFPAVDTVELFCWNLTGNTRSARKEKGGQTLTLPAAPGTNVYGYILKNKGQSVDFGLLAYEKKPSGKLEKLTVDKDFYKAGENIRGKVTLSGKAGMVKVDLTDAYGRKLSEGFGAEFLLPVPEASCRRMYVNAELYDGNVLQSALRLPVAVQVKQPLAAYEIIATGDSGDFRLNRVFDSDRWRIIREIFGAKVVRNWGAGQQLVYTDQLRHGFGSDFPMIRGQRLRNFFKEFSEPYSKTGDKKYLCRKPCFHDRTHFQKVVQDMKKRFERLEKFSPVSYDFDDESSLSKWGNAYDFCFAPATLNAFRQEMKKRYGTVTKLNAEWGTNFPAWEKVEPMTTPEIKKFARKSRNYAAWAEFRDFMDRAYSNWHKAVAEEARKCGITVPIDISGTSPGNAYNGLDWYRWAPFIDQASLYHGNNQEELMRSFAKPGFRATPWFGYTNSGRGFEHQLWYDALLFQRGGASYYSVWSMLRPDYTLNRHAKEFLAVTRDLRFGVGELLNMGKVKTPDVLIHFSQASIFAAAIEEKLQDFYGTRNGWVKVIADSGLDFRFFAAEEIEKGNLLKQPCRVLVLPDSIAMSDKEIAEIGKFIRSGGKVISSGNSGMMNENSRLLKENRLKGSGVIVVENPGSYPYSKRDVRVRSPYAAHLPKQADFSGDISRTRGFIYALPGGGKVFGMVREGDAPETAKSGIHTPERRFWYDVRNSRFLREGTSVPLSLAPGKSAVLAAFKSKLPAPQITVNTGKEVKWQVVLPGSKESTVFRVQIFAPSGKEYELYSRLLPAPGGKAAGSFRPALNDPKGVWTIRCTDRISGMVREKKFTL